MTILGVTASSIAKPTTSFESIASVTVTSSGSQVSFSSIPATYRHLHIRYRARDNGTGGASTELQLYFQNTSGQPYSCRYVNGKGNSLIAGSFSALSTMILFDCIPNQDRTNSPWGVGFIDILDYAVAGKTRVARHMGGHHNNQTGTGSRLTMASGFRNNTAAINLIGLQTASGFLAGSVFSLYGIKGA